MRVSLSVIPSVLRDSYFEYWRNKIKRWRALVVSKLISELFQAGCSGRECNTGGIENII